MLLLLFPYFQLFFKVYVCLCMCMPCHGNVLAGGAGGSAHVHPHECKKRALKPLDHPELELPAAMSLTWLLGTELESSGQAAGIQNH